MGGRVKPTTKRTKALKAPAAKVPKTKRTKVLKTPAAKMTRRQAAEDSDKERDDDALKKDCWQHSYSTMIRIEPSSTASAAGGPQEGFVYCEIHHSSPIKYCVRGGRADASVCQRPDF